MVFEQNFSLRNAELAIYRDHYHVGPFTLAAAVDTADFDGDGRPEVLVVSCDSGPARLTVWNPRTNGTPLVGLALVPRIPAGRADLVGLPLKVSSMAVADLDSDSWPELVVGGEVGGGSTALRGLWSFNLVGGSELWHYSTGIIPGIVAVTDVDGDQGKEVLFQGYAIANGNRANGMGDDSSWVGCVNGDGSMRWCRQVGGTFTNPMVQLLDFDGDGTAELVVVPRGGAAGRSDGTRIVVIEPGTGRIKARADCPTGCEGLVIADFDHDQRLELVVGGADRTVRVYDHDLHPVRQAEFPTLVAVLQAFVLDRRGRTAILGVTRRNSLVVLDANLRLLAETRADEPAGLYYGYAIRTRSGPRVVAVHAPANSDQNSLYSLYSMLVPPRTVPAWLFGLVVAGLLLLGTGVTVAVSAGYRAEMNSTIKGLVRGAAVVRLTGSGRVKSMNRAATELFGFAGRARGLAIADICSGPGLAGLGRLVRDGLTSGGPSSSSELTVQSPGSNTERNVVARLVRVRRSFLLTVEDVSAVEYLRRVETWVPVARSLAHRIKSPLTTMKLLVRQVETRHGGDNPATAEDVSAMKEEVDRLSRMTDGFMRMARLDPPRRRPVSLRALLDRALGRLPVLHQSGITVAQDIGADLPDVLVDEEQFVVALANIVENGVAAMAGKGTLTVRAAPAGGGVLLRITDTGAGMTEEVRARVFEPFYTTKRGGTGLGMAIARKIVEENHAEITVASEVGAGTTVTVRLPAADQPKA